MFKARNMTTDGEYCHQQAMDAMMRLNERSPTTAVTPEQAFVAAAVAAPGLEEESGAPAIVASCAVIICTAFAALLV
jgi:hypothetical protein